MTETIYTIWERHPQSTKLSNGRPRATGPFRTHKELREAVRDRLSKGYNVSRMAAVFKVSWNSIKRIVVELKEKRDGTKDN